MTIQITKPELEAIINERLGTGRFKDAEDVILHALRSVPSESPAPNSDRLAAIARLRNFGKTHGLSRGGITIEELRREARP